MQQSESHAAVVDNDDITMLRDSARDFCQRALPRERLRRMRRDESTFDRQAWRQMADLGWCGLLVPESRDGLDLDMSAAIGVCRELGAVLAPEPVIETAIGATTLLVCLESGDLLLRDCASGDRVVVPALGGVERSAFDGVEATVDGSVYTLNGGCANVPLGSDADGWLVPAHCDGQPAWFYLDAGTQGASAARLKLADGGHDACLQFDRAPAMLLGRGEEATHALTIARSRVEVASSAYLLGLSEALFQITLEYVATRRQFGRAIGSFQVIQHRMVDLYVQIRLATAVVEQAGQSPAEDTPTAMAVTASRARYRACTTTMAMAREAVQLHGAIGLTDECDVGLYVNRTLVMTARYGQADAHAARIGHETRCSPSAATLPADAHEIDADYDPPGGDWNALDDETFRAIVRQWFERNYPPEWRYLPARLDADQSREWYTRLYQRGLVAPAWPVEHGGMGLTADKLLIYMEERERYGVGRTLDQGIIMVGPMLMQHGSAAQQAYYLPHALSGEHIWCQGYSEPNAGSDLASLTTSAVRDGDEFVINGQKIWTTLAQHSTHSFCLVRTDASAKPQAGISFLLIDLAVDGITIRPIRDIAGEDELCEVFFDDVRVPVDCLVGKLNDGWTVAKTLLGFERLFIGGSGPCQRGLRRLRQLAEAHGLLENPAFFDRLTRLEIDVADLESLYNEFADTLRRGEKLGADVSVLKIWGGDAECRLSEVILEAAGDAGGRAGFIEFGTSSFNLLSHYYNARRTPIYGGSNEIQRNILAKHVLRMPSR